VWASEGVAWASVAVGGTGAAAPTGSGARSVNRQSKRFYEWMASGGCRIESCRAMSVARHRVSQHLVDPAVKLVQAQWHATCPHSEGIAPIIVCTKPVSPSRSIGVVAAVEWEGRGGVRGRPTVRGSLDFGERSGLVLVGLVLGRSGGCSLLDRSGSCSWLDRSMRRLWCGRRRTA
jgi:hypothetical protein